jgi:hypothetical protein
MKDGRLRTYPLCSGSQLVESFKTLNDYLRPGTDCGADVRQHQFNRCLKFTAQVGFPFCNLLQDRHCVHSHCDRRIDGVEIVETERNHSAKQRGWNFGTGEKTNDVSPECIMNVRLLHFLEQVGEPGSDKLWMTFVAVGQYPGGPLRHDVIAVEE